MKKLINLYNPYHNGDIFYSRVLTKALLEKFKINYYHFNNQLFEDLNDVCEFNHIPSEFTNNYTCQENPIINTWIGQKQEYLFSKNIGCSFENYFEIVKPILNFFNITIEEPSFYLPEVNYEKIQQYEGIKKIMTDLKIKYKKLILVSSGPVLSQQSLNFDFKEILRFICIDNPNCIIISTQMFDSMPINFIDTSSITKMSSDLLQISYISTFCNTIIGRASGPYCFCHTKSNLLDDKKTFISICNNENEGKWFQDSKAIQKWTNDYSYQNILNLIGKNI